MALNPQTVYNQHLRIRVIESLGGRCKKCGYADVRALQIDHVNSGGVRELKTVIRRSYHNKIIRLVRENPNQTEYQCLCANCNWIKRAESPFENGSIQESSSTHVIGQTQ